MADRRQDVDGAALQEPETIKMTTTGLQRADMVVWVMAVLSALALLALALTAMASGQDSGGARVWLLAFVILATLVAMAWRLVAHRRAREQAESRLQGLDDASRRLHDAQAVARLGDWTCDLATGELSWSPEVYRILQRAPEHGEPTLPEAVAMLEDGSVAIADAYAKARETGEAQHFEAVLRLENDSLRWLDVIMQPVHGTAGGITGMRGTVQDISARKAVELGLSHAKEAAEAASRAKSTFLATMSHEIRTPLNGMLGLLELIDRMAMSAELRTSLQAVQESGRSLQLIIDDILDFSKVEAGKLEIRPEPMRVHEAMDEIHRVYAGSAHNMGLAFSVRVDPAIVPDPVGPIRTAVHALDPSLPIHAAQP